MDEKRFCCLTGRTASTHQNRPISDSNHDRFIGLDTTASTHPVCQAGPTIDQKNENLMAVSLRHLKLLWQACRTLGYGAALMIFLCVMARETYARSGCGTLRSPLAQQCLIRTKLAAKWYGSAARPHATSSAVRAGCRRREAPSLNNNAPLLQGRFISCPKAFIHQAKA